MLPIANSGFTGYRVILHEHQNAESRSEYEVWTGTGVVRFLYPEQMPDEMSSKLAIVKAYSGEGGWEEMAFTQSTFQIYIGAYIPTCPDEYKDIGWRVNKDYYCVVVSSETLNSLRGETINDDSREISQSESKENS